MKLIFKSPSTDDLIRLLKAWRFWLISALVGAALGAAFYYIMPPVYRARATVNVDFHMEQAWPQNTDREQFYYLDRETRKLEEIAWSDAVLNQVVSQTGMSSVGTLRNQKLQLAQPSNGGWHFYVEDKDPKKASALASAWATAFAQAVKAQVANPANGLEQYITADATQVDNLVPHRAVSVSMYALAGTVIFLALSALLVLFFDLKK